MVNTKIIKIIDQHDVRQILKQMLISLDRNVPEDFGVFIPNYFFWFHSPVFAVIKILLGKYGSVYYSGNIVMSLSVLGFCELAAVADYMCQGFCMLFAQPASWILHSVVDLVCHCPGVESLLLSAMIRALVFTLMLLLLSH